MVQREQAEARVAELTRERDALMNACDRLECRAEQAEQERNRAEDRVAVKTAEAITNEATDE